MIPLLNPDVVKGKGRPKGALGKKNTAILVVVNKPVLAPPARGRGRGRGSRGEEDNCIKGVMERLVLVDTLLPSKSTPISSLP